MTADQTPEPVSGRRRADTPNAWIHSPELRRYVYLAVAAIVAGLIVFGLITQEQVEQWVQTTIAVLGIITALLAARNVPSKE